MVFGKLGGLFRKIAGGLAKTRAMLGDALRGLLTGRRAVDQDFLDELEEILLGADVGVTKTDEIIEELRAQYENGAVAEGEDLLGFLKASLRKELQDPNEDEVQFANEGPTVILVVGVNGTGKTTSIAKLAKRFSDQGKKVVLAAGDTYRAAAVQQLTIWAERVGVDIVKQEQGADAAAVAFDAVASAQSRGADIVLIDTAGRLQNREDLMRELGKITRVIQKHMPEAPHETLLVLDATSGQNVFRQAEVFGGTMGVTGLILTKLDGTAKGGCVISIKRELNLPIRYIGIGEKEDDLQPFDPDAFITGIFDGIE